MLYMIGMMGADHQIRRFLIKIGYTSDIKKRMRQYKTYNPIVIPMYSIAGNKKLEKQYHKLLSKIGEHYSGEWYSVNKTTFFSLVDYGFLFFPIKFSIQHNLMR